MTAVRKAGWNEDAARFRLEPAEWTFARRGQAGSLRRMRREPAEDEPKACRKFRDDRDMPRDRSRGAFGVPSLATIILKENDVMKSAVRTSLLAAALSLAGASAPLLAAPPALAAEVEPPSEFRLLREKGIALHDAAREGDGDAAAEAVEALERYLKRFPRDGEARAYLGSAYAQRGRDASSVVNKMRYTNRGLRHLDRALDAAPRDFTVRFIRATVNASLPEMFGRGEAATEDMLALDEIFRARPSPRMAGWMTGIYEALQERAPDAGPWGERLERARTLSGGE